MHDRNSRAAKWPGDARAPEVSSEFGPEEAPTRPSNAQLSAGFGAKPPLVRRQSAKIRKIAAPATPPTKVAIRPIAKPIAKPSPDERPTIRPPTPSPTPTPPPPLPSPQLSIPTPSRPMSPAIRRRLQDASDDPLPPVLDPSAIAKARPSPIPTHLPKLSTPLVALPPPAMIDVVELSSPPPREPVLPPSSSPLLSPSPSPSPSERPFPLSSEAVPTLPAPAPEQEVKIVVPLDAPEQEVKTVVPLDAPEQEVKTVVPLDAPVMKGARSGAGRWALRLAVLVALVGGELAFAQRTGMLDLPHDVGEARTMLVTAMRGGSLESAASPAAASVTPSVAEPPSDPNASEASDVITIPPNMGLITTTHAKPGHRIFVDDRTVGETPGAVLVKCGSATVKLGSAGSAQSINVPCGEPMAVDDR